MTGTQWKNTQGPSAKLRKEGARFKQKYTQKSQSHMSPLAKKRKMTPFLLGAFPIPRVATDLVVQKR